MTGTMHGVLIYRIQDRLKHLGYPIPYDQMSKALNESLYELEQELNKGDSLAMPTGATMTMDEPMRDMKKRMGF